MSKTVPNETIRRLDRRAARLGLPLVKLGGNKREFTLDDGSRVLRYQPGGKGVVKVESFRWDRNAAGEGVGDWLLDATAHRTVDGMEALFAAQVGA